MRSLSKLTFSLTAVVLAVGCGKTETMASQADASQALFSTDAIIAEVAPALSADTVAKAAKSFSGLSIAEFSSRVEQDAKPSRVDIDGVVFTTAAADITARDASWAKLGEQYPTVEAYWQASKFTPGQLNASSLQDAMRFLIAFQKKGSPSLALVLGSQVITGARDLYKLAKDTSTLRGALTAAADPDTYATIKKDCATLNFAKAVVGSGSTTGKKISALQTVGDLGCMYFQGESTINRNVSVRN